MKYLCICDGGNVRSHAMAYVLKHEYPGDHEAIAIGRQWSSEGTLQYMCDWADWIVIMQPHMIESIPEGSRHKVKVVDVGPDTYGVYIHPQLVTKVRVGADELLK